MKKGKGPESRRNVVGISSLVCSRSVLCQTNFVRGLADGRAAGEGYKAFGIILACPSGNVLKSEILSFMYLMRMLTVSICSDSRPLFLCARLPKAM